MIFQYNISLYSKMIENTILRGAALLGFLSGYTTEYRNRDKNKPEVKHELCYILK